MTSRPPPLPPSLPPGLVSPSLPSLRTLLCVLGFPSLPPSLPPLCHFLYFPSLAQRLRQQTERTKRNERDILCIFFTIYHQTTISNHNQNRNQFHTTTKLETQIKTTPIHRNTSVGHRVPDSVAVQSATRTRHRRHRPRRHPCSGTPPPRRTSPQHQQQQQQHGL